MSSTRRAFDIVKFSMTRGFMATRELARQLELPVASAHRLLHRWGRASVAGQLGSGDWELSFRLVQIVGRQLRRQELPGPARTTLENLSDVTKETAFQAVQGGRDIVYAIKC